MEAIDIICAWNIHNDVFVLVVDVRATDPSVELRTQGGSSAYL